MRITRASSSPIDIRLSASVRTGAGSIGDRGGIRISVETEDFTGIGEVAPIPGVNGPGLEKLATEITDWAEAAVFVPVDEALGSLDEGGLSRLSRFAVHCALADLKAKAADLPASQWLRAGSTTRIRINALIGEANPAAVHQRATELVAQNVSAIKLKVGAVDPSLDITRIVAASEAAGSNTELRIDANGAWTIDTALRVIGRVGKHRLSYIEDPTADLAEFAQVQAESGVAVALDLDPTGDPREAIERAGVHTLVVKPAALGGMDKALDLVRQYPDQRFVISSSIQREVGLAAAVHTAAAIAHEHPGPHGLATGRLIRRMDPTLLDVNGEVRVPAGPGVWNEAVDPIRS